MLSIFPIKQEIAVRWGLISLLMSKSWRKVTSSACEEWSNHLLWNSTMQSMRSSSLSAPKVLGHDSITRFLQKFALGSLKRLPRMWSMQRVSWLVVSRVKPQSTSPTRPARPTPLKANLATPFLFLSSRLPGVPNIRTA